MTWIKDKTGRTDAYWMKRIGNLIQKYVTGKKVMVKGNVHDTTDVLAWIKELCAEVHCKTVAKLDGKFDENMAFASVLSMILVRWWLRLIKAKAFDPRRPVKLRRKAMERRMVFLSNLLREGIEERFYPKDFPKQKWDWPFDPKAKDGKYV